jgi:hypothetical protein
MCKAKKLFVVSDIHGYLPPLKAALASAGFDENNPSHIFVCCGDLFDKDNLNEALLDYISGLQHKILILGDREDVLSDTSEIPESLRTLIHHMQNYYETENALFVHGWIPKGDFRTADEQSWRRARTVGWHESYGENTDFPEKTIVCGHIPTRLAYTFAPDWDLSDSGIYYGDGVIAVNGGVESCGKINVLILKENK